MKRWWLIGTALVLLAVLVGGILQQQGVFHHAQSAASSKPEDERATPAGATGREHNMSAASIKPADEHVMQYLHTLLETWKRHAEEPTQRKP
jgi:hypothetical protein